MPLLQFAHQVVALREYMYVISCPYLYTFTYTRGVSVCE
jgi:hypothetical protein